MHNYIYPVKYFLSKEGSKIAFVENGSGTQTLLFIHGLSSYLAAFNYNLPELSKQYKCIAIDLPGYGLSETTADSGNMQYYSDLIAEFIKKQKLNNVVLCGHSMGGYIAQLTALNYPEIVDKLVLFAPAGLEKFVEEENVLIKNTYTKKSIGSKTKDRIVASFKSNFFSMPDYAVFMIEDYIELSKSKIFPNYVETVIRSLYFMVDNPIYHRLKDIKQPILLFYGTNDRLIPHPLIHKNSQPKDIFGNAHNIFNNVSIKQICNCGHFIQMEHYHFVNETIVTYLL